MEFVEIALPVAQQLGLKLDVTSDQQEMSELLGPEAWQALSSFSQLANKSTGSAHPNDRDRWFNFLILEHETGGRLSTELLERWLTEEERWPDNVASELVLQFEFGTDLLNAYDTRRR